MRLSFLKTWNLRTKLMFILVVFVLSPLMLFGTLFYQRSKELVVKRTDQEGEQVLTLVKQNVNQLLLGYDAWLNDIYEHENIVKSIADSNAAGGEAGATEADDSVNRYLRDFLRGKDDLDSIYLFTPKRTYFGDFKGPTLFTDQYDAHPEWERSIRLAEGRTVWLPTYELPQNQYSSKSSHYFAVGMQVKNVFNSLETLGTLVFSVKIEALDAIIGSAQVSPHSALLICDSEGRIVWNRNPDAYDLNLSAYDFFDRIGRQASGRFTRDINGSVYRIRYLRSESNGWNYVSFVPQSDLNAQTADLKQFFVATAVAFAAVFILLAALSSYSVTKPLRKMALAMRQIHKDNVDLVMQPQSTDEVGMLQSSFNHMRHRINDLIQEVRFVSQKEKEAEVRALQAQINPHFVYNTLDAVNWLAIENDQSQISSMITSLSDIMRYAIRPGEQLVPIEEELKWARNYAYLQEMRFEEKFVVQFDVEIDAMDLKVPRLLFQPYMENSIIHGMEDRESGGLIRIVVRSPAEGEERKVVIAIEDNGGGIPPERLKQIKERRSHGIGIFNLDDRLKMEHGYGYGIEIRSTYGEGTAVSIVLPYIR